MIVLKLALIFILVMVIISRKQPIYTAVSIGALLTWLFYGISLKDGFSAILTGAFSKSTLSLIVVMYIVTFLQKMMEQRGAIYRAQKASVLFLITAGSTVPPHQPLSACCRHRTPHSLPAIS